MVTGVSVWRSRHSHRCPLRLWVLLTLSGQATLSNAQTASINLTATVADACQASIEATSTGLHFGTMDFGEYASLASTIFINSSEQAGSIGVTCVSGQSYTILLGGGDSGDTSNRQMSGASAGGKINYNLYTSSAYSTIWDDAIGVSATGDGNEQWHTVYGRVPAQDTPAADVYSDTVNVTIAW